MPIPRNPVVRAGAILRKGGVHRQSASGHRHQGKRQLDDEVDEWFADATDESDEVCLPRSRRVGRKRGWSGSTPDRVDSDGVTFHSLQPRVKPTKSRIANNQPCGFLWGVEFNCTSQLANRRFIQRRQVPGV